MKDGRRFGCPPEPYEPPDTINLTDLDSRNLKTPRRWVQGYNAQAATNERQIVIAAEVTIDSPDFGHLGPMVAATQRELQAAAVTHTPAVVVADAGYWHQAQMQDIVAGGNPGDRAPGRQQATGRPAGMGRRPVRVYAPGA